jgi:2-iminobutanoate/2-iminopropanoate deaminase
MLDIDANLTYDEAYYLYMNFRFRGNLFMSKQNVSTEQAPAAIGPYSQGIVAGGFLFLSGQTPLDPNTGVLVEGSVEEQAARVLENLGAVLAAAGLGFENVVKTTVFLRDMADFAVVNGVYATYFPQPYPARSTIAVAGLPKDARVEIEAIALRR